MNWNHLLPRPKIGERGFTLLEIVVVLFIISIMAALVAPNYFKRIQDARENSIRKEMQAIHAAIMGDPEVGDYGYVGDMGKLPDSLDDLNIKPAGVPEYSSIHTNGIGMGWNGHYVNLGFDAIYTQDAWGNSYIYSATSGQITSLGGDGTLGTNDDLTIPPNAVNTTGDISVTVKADSATLPGTVKVLDNSEASVWVYYSSNGTQDSTLASWNGSAFTTVGWASPAPHRGVHAIEATGIVSYNGLSATANAVVLRGTTAVTIFID